MIVTISVQSEYLGDVRVSEDVEDANDAEAQVVRMIAKVASRVRKAYDVEDPF